MKFNRYVGFLVTTLVLLNINQCLANISQPANLQKYIYVNVPQHTDGGEEGQKKICFLPSEQENLNWEVHRQQHQVILGNEQPLLQKLSAVETVDNTVTTESTPIESPAIKIEHVIGLSNEVIPEPSSTKIEQDLGLSNEFTHESVVTADEQVQPVCVCNKQADQDNLVEPYQILHPQELTNVVSANTPLETLPLQLVPSASNSDDLEEIGARNIESTQQSMQSGFPPTDLGFPPQPIPNNGFPPQPNPNNGFPPRPYPNNGFPPQPYPNNRYPSYPDDGYGPQPIDPNGYPPQPIYPPPNNNVYPPQPIYPPPNNNVYPPPNINVFPPPNNNVYPLPNNNIFPPPIINTFPFPRPLMPVQGFIRHIRIVRPIFPIYPRF